MKYYANFDSKGVLIDCGINELITDSYGSSDVVNTVIPEDLYIDYKAEPKKYIAGKKKGIPYPVINPNYEQEQAAIREADFNSKFFYINGFGWYRKQPKGYQSAVESMNVLFNIANVTDGIQAGLIIFYQQPDFTKEEECTEAWLIEHQIIQPAMTKQAFLALYVAFMTAWNTEEHEAIIGE